MKKMKVFSSLRRFAALLLAMTLLLGGVLGSGGLYGIFSGIRSAYAASSVDLDDYITSASFSSDSIYAGDSVQLTIDYSISSAVLLAEGTSELTYHLPEGVKPVKEESGTVYNGATAVGTYTISSDGTITVDLYSSFVNSGNTIDGELKFFVTLDASAEEEEKTYEYTFSETNKVTTSITVKGSGTSGGGGEQKRTDLNTQKTYKIDGSTDDSVTVTYTIEIRSNSGTGEESISFTDSISKPSGITVSVGTITVTKTDKTGGSSTVTDSLNTDASGNITGTLPSLGEGESYQISYTVTYSGISSVNGSIDLYNSVSATTQNLWSGDNTNIRMNHTYLSKSSRYDSTSDQIVWTIVINDFGADMSGYTVSDTLTNASGSTVLIDTVTVTESGGGTYTGIPLPFTIAQADGTHLAGTYEGGTLYVSDPTHQLTITYTTDVSSDGFYTTYQNSASLNKDNENYSGSTTQAVDHASGTLSKSLTDQSGKDSDNTKTYSWTVTQLLPSGGITVGSYYEDSLSSSTYTGTYHYITAEQLHALTVCGVTGSGDSKSSTELSGVWKIQVNTGSGWSDWTYSSSDTNQYTSFRIVFTSAVTGYDSIEISYSSTADLSAMKNETWTFTNSGTFTQDGHSVYASDSVKESEGGYILKTDAGGGSGSYTYDESKGILYYALYFNMNGTLKEDGDITITDVLPEGTVLYTEPYTINWSGYNRAKSMINDTGTGVKIYFSDGSASGYGGIWDTDNYYGQNGNSYQSDYNPNDYITVSYDETTNTLSITIPQDVYYAYYSYYKVSQPFVIFYAVQITDMLGLGDEDPTTDGSEKSYTNNVTLTVGSSTYTDSITDTVTSSYISKSVNSEAESSAMEIPYSIIINPTSATLNGGTTVTVTDTVEYGQYIKNVTLVPGTFHLYKMNADGSRGAEEHTANYTMHYEEVIDSSSNISFVLTLEIPDGCAYILEYTYLFTFDENAAAQRGGADVTVLITNGITIEGSNIGSDSSSAQQEYVIESSSATATTQTITIVKEDDENEAITLQGAFFTLSKFDLSAWQEDASPSKDVTEEKYWTKIGTYITDESGQITLSGLEQGSAYRLHEDSAPTNYEDEIDENGAPIEYYYFYYAQLNDSWPSDLLALLQEEEDGWYIQILNRKTDDHKTSSSVRKVWENSRGQLISGSQITDEKGHVITGIEIALIQTTYDRKTGETTQSVYNLAEEGEDPVYTYILEPDANGSWYYVFSNLPEKTTDENGNITYEYSYTVIETGFYTYAGSSDSSTFDPKDPTSLTNAAVSGYTTAASQSGTTTTITNQKTPSETSVTVNKVWDESAGGDVTVTVTLYQSSTAPNLNKVGISISVTVSDPYGNSAVYPVLGAYEVSETGSTVTVYVKNPNSSYINFSETASVTIGGVSSGVVQGVSDGSGGYIFTVKNVTGDLSLSLSTDGWSTSATVSAELSGSAQEGMAVLPEDAVTGDTTIDWGERTTTNDSKVTLSSSNSWTYTWTNLPDNYYYYIVESTPSGYEATYTYTTSSEGDAITSVTITNKKTDNTSVSVKKVWQGGSSSTKPAVTAQLYRSTVSPEGGKITLTLVDSSTGQVLSSEDHASYAIISLYRYENWQITDLLVEVTLSAANGFSYTFVDPDYQPGNQYTWQCIAYGYYGGNISGVYGYKTVSDSGTTTDWSQYMTGAGTMYIGAYYNAYGSMDGEYEPSGTQESTDDVKSYAIPQSALYMGSDYDLILDASNNWSASWDDLPYADGAGSILYYYVKEITVEGYITVTSYEQNEDGFIYAYTITNIPETEEGKTAVTVQKVWQSADGSDITADATDTVTVSLYTNDGTLVGTVPLGPAYAGGVNYSGTDEEENPIVSGYYSEDGYSYTWVNLDEGTYYVSESPALSGYETTYELLDNTVLPTSKPKIYSCAAASVDGPAEAVYLADEAATSVTTSGGTIEIINKKSATTLSVEKAWSGEDGTDGEGHTVTMDLYRTTSNLSNNTAYLNVHIDVSKWYFDNGVTLSSASYAGSEMVWVGIYKIPNEEGEYWWDYDPVADTTLGSWNGFSWDGILPYEEGTSYYVIYGTSSGILSIGVASQTGGTVDVSSCWTITGDAKDNELHLSVVLDQKVSENETDMNVSGSVSAYTIEGAETKKADLTNASASFIEAWFGFWDNTDTVMEEEKRLNSSTCPDGDWSFTLTIPASRGGAASSYTLLYDFAAGVLSYEITVKRDGTVLTENPEGGYTIAGDAASDVTVEITVLMQVDPNLLGAASGEEEPGEDEEEEEESHTSNAFGTADGAYVGSWDGEYVGSVTINANNNWSYTWNNLDQYDENGNPYYYYVVESGIDNSAETAGDGWYTSYTYYNGDTKVTVVDGEVVSSFDKVLITNQKATSIRVQKAWEFFDGKEIPKEDLPDGITVTLWKRGASSAEDEKIDSVILNEQNGWTYVWDRIDNGDYYYVAEGDLGEVYKVTYTADPNEGDAGSATSNASDAALSVSGTITIKNTYKEEKTSVTVKKTWVDQANDTNDNAAHSGDEVVVHLYRFSTAEKEGAESDSEMGGSGTITANVSSWLTEEGIAVGAPEITDWWDNNGNGGSIWVGLYKMPDTESGETGDWWDEQHYVSGDNLTYDKDWTVTFTGLTVGETYVVTMGGSGAVFCGEIVVSDGSESTVTLTEETPNATVSFTATIDPSYAEWSPFDTIYLSSAYASLDGYSEDGWTYTWQSLLTEDLDGSAFLYYVIEEPVGGYSTSYVYTVGNGEDGSVEGVLSSVDITNTKATSISVKKIWQNADGEEITELLDNDLTASVQLYVKNDAGDDTPYGPLVTLEKENGWAYTWEDLPYGNDYYVLESASEGFDVTYTSDAILDESEMADASSSAVTGGEITLTNRENEKDVTVSVEKSWHDYGSASVTHEGVTVSLYRYEAVTSSGQEVYVGNATGSDETGSLTVSASSWVDENGNLLTPTAGTAPAHVPGSIGVNLYTVNESDTWIWRAWGVLSAENGWSVTFTGLDISEDDGEGATYILQYWVENSGDSTLISVSADEENDALQWANDESAAFTVSGDISADLTVLVKSAAALGTAVTGEGIESQVTLNTGNQWKYTWSSLPAYSDGGHLYHYYLIETPIDGYSSSQSVSSSTNENGTVSYEVSLVNTALTSLVVKKVWLDANGSPIEESDVSEEDKVLPDEITFTLSRYTGTEEEKSDLEVVGSQTFGEAGGSAGGSGSSFGSDTGDSGSGTEEDGASITVEIGKWVDESGNEIADFDPTSLGYSCGVWLNIYNSSWDQLGITVDSLTASDWTSTVSSLVADTAYIIQWGWSLWGDAGEYTVVGLDADGMYSRSGNDILTDGSILVTATESGTTISLTATVKLTAGLDDGSGEQEGASITIEIGKWVDESGQEITDFDPTSAVAYSCGGWLNVYEGYWDTKVSLGDGAAFCSPDWSYTVTGLKEGELYTIQWGISDWGNTSDYTIVKLDADGMNDRGSSDDLTSGSIYVTAVSGNLSVNLTATVVQSDYTGSSVSRTALSAGIGTLLYGGISVLSADGSAVASPSADSSGTSAASLDAAFLDDGETKEDASDESWTFIWNDLPLFDEEGNAYTYVVSEVAVDGFTTTVGEITTETDENGKAITSVTIENQLNTEQPGVTLPSTGQKFLYTIYLIGLVLLAAAAAVWFFSRRKRSDPSGE